MRSFHTFVDKECQSMGIGFHGVEEGIEGREGLVKAGELFSSAGITSAQERLQVRTSGNINLP